jgi:hypothetical protein
MINASEGSLCFKIFENSILYSRDEKKNLLKLAFVIQEFFTALTPDNLIRINIALFLAMWVTVAFELYMFFSAITK